MHSQCRSILGTPSAVTTTALLVHARRVLVSLWFVCCPVRCFCREAHALKLKAQREEEDRKLAQQIAANGTPVKGKK